MTHPLFLFFFAFAFLMGSIPFGVVFTRIFHAQNITQLGSGNIGATNVSRVFGFWPTGALTFLCDVLKGILPLLLFKIGGAPPSFDLWFTGFISVLGHCYSPWLKFRGGKGVATGFGVILVLSPLAALAGALGYALSFLQNRVGSVSSLIGILFMLAAQFVLYPPGEHLFVLMGLFFVIILKHEKNLDSLLEGKEKTFLFLFFLIFIKAFLLNALIPNAFAQFPCSITDTTGTTLQLTSEPQKIITLAPSLGELAADFLGSETEKIIGVSEYTDYPPKLKEKPSIGPYFRFNIEQIQALKPDLVLATQDGNPKDQVLHLRELGVPVLVVNTQSFRDIFESISIVSRALGKKSLGEKMAEQLKRGIANIQLKSKNHKKLKVLLQIGDHPLVVVGKKSFLHEALETIGATNVYSDSLTSYPKPSLEDAIQRNPDVILILTLDKNLNHFYKIKNEWYLYKQVKAVKNDKVHILFGDTLLRPTLRLLEGLSMLSKKTYE